MGGGGAATSWQVSVAWQRACPVRHWSMLFETTHCDGRITPTASLLDLFRSRLQAALTSVALELIAVTSGRARRACRHRKT
jgi:hypothetical protein